MTIGENIKRIRKEKGLTQLELANKCDILYQTLGKYERNVLNPKLETITKIAKALDVGIFTIIDFSDTNEENLIDIKKDLLKEEFLNEWSGDEKQIRLNVYFNLLNQEGKEKALDNIGVLTKVDDYKKK